MSNSRDVFGRHMKTLTYNPYGPLTDNHVHKLIKQAMRLPPDTDYMTASESIVQSMEQYGLATVEREFAHCIDGLKKVHRRIIVTFGKIEHPQKCHPMVGRVIELHCHGDISIYDAMCKLMQPFNTVVALVEPHGAHGSYADPAPAAPRYLEANSSPFSRDVFFNGVEAKSLQHKPTEVGHGTEISYFIPRLPMALLTGNFGIGIGFKSEIPVHELSNICDLVITYVKVRQKSINIAKHHKKLSKYLLPDFTSHCLIRNGNEVMSKITQGNFKYTIEIDGILEVSPGLITIRTLPPLVDPSKLEDIFIPQFKDKHSWVSQNFQAITPTSSGMDYAQIRFVLKRKRDPFLLLEQLKKMVKFHKRWRPIWHWANLNGRITESGPYELLDVWYNARYKSIQVELKMKQDRYLLKLRELDALLKVRDHSKEIVAAFDNAKDNSAVVTALCKKFNLTAWQVNFLFKLRLEQLTAKEKDKLQMELDTVLAKKKDLIRQLGSIPDRIIEDAKYFKRTYGPSTPRKGKLANTFQGYVKVGDTGIIQYWDTAHLKSILIDWSNADIAIHQYNPKHKFKYLLTDTGVAQVKNKDLPQIMNGRAILTSDKPFVDIVVLGKDTMSKLKGLKHKFLTKTTLVPVGAPKCTFITKRGEVYTDSTNTITTRKTTTALGVKADVVMVSDKISDAIVIVYGNPKQKNTLRMDIIREGTGKLAFLPMGTNKIVWIGAASDPVQISVPNDILNRCKLKHIQIDDALALMDTKQRAIIKLNYKQIGKIPLIKHKSIPGVFVPKM